MLSSCRVVGDSGVSGTTIGSGRVVAFELAGFWRRIGAMLLDLILLGIAGWAIGTGLQDRLMAMGQEARLIGLPIAVLYYRTCNSRLLGGTPGKHALGLRVMRRDGRGIGLAASIWRALVYLVPLYLNG